MEKTGGNPSGEMSLKKPSATSNEPAHKGQNNNNNSRCALNKPVAVKQPKFEGKCEELKGHIYDCSDARQADVFVKTTREVGEFMGRTFKYGNDTK